MRKYRASGQVCLADSEQSDSLHNINCFVYGYSPVDACENLVNNEFVEGLDSKLLFVGVETDTPGHLDCPLTGGFLSFLEDGV